MSCRYCSFVATLLNVAKIKSDVDTDKKNYNEPDIYRADEEGKEKDSENERMGVWVGRMRAQRKSIFYHISVAYSQTHLNVIRADSFDSPAIMPNIKMKTLRPYR